MTARSAGFVTVLDAGLIGRASVVLGGGRDTLDDAIDPGVGIMIRATVGDPVRRATSILELRYRDAGAPAGGAAAGVSERGDRLRPRSPRPITQCDLIIDEVV